MVKKDTDELYEGDTQCYRWEVTHGPCGTPVLLTEVSTITATLRDEESGNIVNSRNAQNVKNANNGTYANGYFDFALQALDTTFQVAANDQETHVLEVKLTQTDAQVRTLHLEIVCLRRPAAAGS
mgnify:CR=1 FL=1